MRVGRVVAILWCLLILAGCKSGPAQRVYSADLTDAFAAVCVSSKAVFGAHNCRVDWDRHTVRTGWFADPEYSKPTLIDIDEEGLPRPREDDPPPRSLNKPRTDRDTDYYGSTRKSEWSVVVTCKACRSGTIVCASVQTRDCDRRSHKRAGYPGVSSLNGCSTALKAKLEQYLGPPIKDPKI